MFPSHDHGGGSREEKSFKTIRPKVLKVVNNKIRSIENLLDSYALLKVQEYKPILQDIQVDLYDFRKKWKINTIGGKENDREGNRRGE